MTDRELFVAALERPEAERQAWLDQACAGNAELRRRLNVLLRAHELASQFLAAPAAGGLTRATDPAKGDPPDDVLALLAPPDAPGHLGKLDHYQILEAVGKGGMGVVLKAFDPLLHRVVAVKLVAPHLAANAPARRRFEREARAVAAVRDDHVVAIHAVEPNKPTPYLVMEFIGGVSLQDRLEQRGPFEVKEILRIGMQTASGLAAAHAQGLVHRDIKPANILLENGIERVKITDFGLARAVNDANLTQSGVITGTPNYMSPEQADGRPVDARSDLFSLGSVLYALATGYPPFRADGLAAVLKRVAADTPRPVREINADVPDWLEAILQKLHAKNPAERFQTAKEVADLLGRHLAHLQQPSQVPMPARVEPPTEERQPVTLRVQATGNGRVVRWGPFKQGRLVDTAGLSRLFLPTVTLTDVIADLCELAESLDGGYQVVVPWANGMTSTSFQMLLIGRGFEIRCVRQLMRGGFPLNPVAAEFGANYDVVVSVNTPSAEVRSKVLGLLRSKYPCPAADAPESRPASSPEPRKAPSKAESVEPLLVRVITLRHVLLWAFTMGLLVTETMLVVELWENPTNPSLFVIVLGIASPLSLIGFYFASRRDQRRRAASGEPIPRDVPPEPPPRHDGWTAFALGGGFVVLLIGFLLTRSLDDFAWLKWEASEKVAAKAWLLGLYGLPALLSFGPGVYLARRRWRRRFGPDHRGEWRAAFLAALGVWSTVASVALTIRRDPALHAHLFRGSDQARLDVNWNPSFVDRVTVERNGEIVAGFSKTASGFGGPVPPGTYTVLGVKDGGEVYRSRFSLGQGERLGISMFLDVRGPREAYLRVICDDPELRVSLTGAFESLAFNAPGSRTTLGQRLRPGEAYQLTIARGGVTLHRENLRLNRGELREMRIPPVVVPERTVRLVPKQGSFPSDVTRMEVAPDRTAVAVGRLDGPVQVFDAATGKERFTVSRPKSDCTAFGFTPDGKQLAYLTRADHGETLRLVDARDGGVSDQELKPKEGYFSNARALAFSPDGKRLAVSSAYNQRESSFFRSRLHRWEWPSGKQLPTTVESQDGTIEAMRFTPDGAAVAAVSGAKDFVLWTWDAAVNANARRGHTEQFVHDLVAGTAAHKNAFAIAGWNESTGKPGLTFCQHAAGLVEPKALGPMRFASLALSADGSLLAAGAKGGSAAVPWEQRAVIRLWDAKTGKERAVLLGHADWPLDISFTPDGGQLVSASKDGTLRWWRPARTPPDR